MSDPLNPTRSLTAIIEDVMALCDERDLSLGEIIAASGRAGILPVLILVSVIVVSPLSAIPLFSSVSGMLIFLISAQIALGRRHLWLPGFLTRRQLKAERVTSSLKRLLPVAGWVDRRSKQRLSFLVRRPLSQVLMVVCGLCGLAMPFFELVPMSATLLASTVALITLAILVKDGLLATFAVLPFLLALGVITKILT
ncbi:MAG: exopolysaccharide biosynthesis protein [Pseudomonadota bacterium]